MTIHDLQRLLTSARSLHECSQGLLEHLPEVRNLFYGLTQEELHETRLDYDDTLLMFSASPAGRELRQSPANATPPVLSLLAFFLSFLERARLYQGIRHLANMLPPGSLSHRAEAMFDYKYITNARTDYITRFPHVLSLVHAAGQEPTTATQDHCSDLMLEYALEALLTTRKIGIDIRKDLSSSFLDSSQAAAHPCLGKAARAFHLPDDRLEEELSVVRSRLVEAFHHEACRLVPHVLLLPNTEDPEPTLTRRPILHHVLPAAVDKQLAAMGAIHDPQRSVAKTNYDADDHRNRIYLGTYFPRTLLEAMNVVSEVLSIPAVQAAFRKKSTIRVLDLGCGTGAASLGAIIAICDSPRTTKQIELHSIDVNQDALSKQAKVLAAIAPELQCSILPKQETVHFPHHLDGYVPALANLAERHRSAFDLIICWKFLCEFYNTNFAQAQGIIFHTLRSLSHMLSHDGICIVADVTAKDNKYEYFSCILNREANQHDALPNKTMQTILPLPCGRHSTTCSCRCFTQRAFAVHHRLAQRDHTKIAYRVFAPLTTASSVLPTFTRAPHYNVNHGSPREACAGQGQRNFPDPKPCGFTEFRPEES